MKRKTVIGGWVALAALLAIARGGSSVELPANVGNCLKTVGAVEYNYNATLLPKNARNLACYFNNGESCYSFVPHDAPESVEYGCGKIDVDDLPESCNEARRHAPENVCFKKAFHNGEKGSLCCCTGDMCNIPQNVEKILPTTTSAPTTIAPSTTVSEFNPEVTAVNRSSVAPAERREAPDEENKWWYIPLLLFVIFTLLMIFFVVVVLIFVLAKIKSYRKQQSELSKGIDQRLKDHAEQVTEENRNQTLQTFRSLVEQYHAARRARRQAMDQQSRNRESQKTLPTEPASQTSQSQKSLKVESENEKSKSSSILFGLLPRNPCCSTRGREGAEGVKEKVSLEKLPRVENV